jgi:hypothetical protein
MLILQTFPSTFKSQHGEIPLTPPEQPVSKRRKADPPPFGEVIGVMEMEWVPGRRMAVTTQNTEGVFQQPYGSSR